MVTDTSIDEDQHLDHSCGGPWAGDPLSRVVQAFLVIYLAPVIILVFATGAVLVMVLGVGKMVVRAVSFVNSVRRGGRPAGAARHFYQGFNTAHGRLGGRSTLMASSAGESRRRSAPPGP